jgi:hypothetical protein
MPIVCRRCGSSDFRVSRFRLGDIRRLLVLQLPVRCHACMLRDFVFFPWIFKLRNAARARQRERSVRGIRP